MEFRAELDPLAPYKPPRMSQEAAAERETEGYVKLTSNELSFGPLPEAEVALAEALPRANRYPDRHAASLRESVAAANPGTDPARNVLVGNGSSEVLFNLLQLVERPGEVVFPWPSFGLYVAIGITLGLGTRKVPLAQHHEAKPEALLSAVTDETRAVILANPNNPTGTYLTLEEVRTLADSLPEDVFLILDEAYQVAATASMRAREKIRARAEFIIRERERVQEAFRAAGLNYIPSQGNFVLVETGPEVFEKAGVLVREGEAL